MKQVFGLSERCLSCHQCETSCAIAHSKGKTLGDALTEDVTPLNRIHVRRNKRTHKPVVVKCRHCNPAPCIHACMTGALVRDFRTGLVVVDEKKCTGCGICREACLFDVIRFAPTAASGRSRVSAVKCDGCIGRVREGDVPACVDSCMTGALVYATVDERLQLKQGTQQAGGVPECISILNGVNHKGF